MKYTARRFTALALSAAMATTLFPAASVAFAEQTNGSEATEAPAASAQTGTAGGTGESTASGTGSSETAGTATGSDATHPGTATGGGTAADSGTAQPGTGTDTGAEDAKRAKEVADEIVNLPTLGEASHENAKAIKQVYKDFTALSAAAKALVPKSATDKLTGLHNALDAAEKVAKSIEGLPAASAAKKNEYAAILKVAKSYGKLAQPNFVKKSLQNKIAELEEHVYYASTPAPSYKVTALSGGKTTTVKDTEAHTFKGGIGRIKVSVPKSAYDSKTALSGTLSYGVKIAGKKASTASKSAWVGSKSKKKTVQAFRLDFNGTIAEHYDVYYRVKVSRLGWSSWGSNGTWAGSTGMSLRITGLQVEFVKKGGKAPGSTTRPCPGASTVSYQVNQVQGGWTSLRKSGSTAGTASWKAGIKQIKIQEKGTLGGSVQTSVLPRKGGWTAYTSGTVGSSSNSKQAQAVRIKLTGEVSKVYDVYYRVYASDHHWLGWAKNGQKAGTSGHKYSMGAIQVRLVRKGEGAPGSTSGHFTTKAVSYSSGGQLTMSRKAQGYSSSTGWLVLVNRSTTHVGVFKGSKNNWKLVRYMTCDVGASSTPTPKGTRHVQYRIPSFGEEKGYSVYKATNIGGAYFFHSILYYANTRNVMDGTLGAWCSHGCIRLAYGNAKYIYDHVSNGTTVKIY